MTLSRSVLVAPTDGQVVETDILVVGSGAGGAGVAGELRRLGHDVLVVEAGPAGPSTPGGHVSNLEDERLVTTDELTPHAMGDPIEGLTGVRAYHGVGGLLTRWAGMVPRPHLTAEWDGTLPESTLSSLLDEAEALVASTPVDELTESGSPAGRGPLTGWLLRQLWGEFGAPPAIDAAQPMRIAAHGGGDRIHYTGADTLLEAPSEAGSLRVLADHVVREILTEGDRAIGAVAIATGGTQVTLRARVVVVAAGAIGTPQLLQASSITSDALGHYLTDHLNAFVMPFPLVSAAPDMSDAEANASIVLPVSEDRAFQVAFVHTFAQSRVDIDGHAERKIGVGILIGTDPAFENHLSFDPSRTDGFGLPLVRAHVRSSAADKARVGQALGVAYRAAESVGNPWGGPIMLGERGSSLHVMGTHRMGRDRKTSVTDPECRVWDWNNLYLAGNGILGARNSCNPTLTTIALALHTARAIHAQHPLH